MIQTHSAFYYGFTVRGGNNANYKLDFSEAATGTLRVATIATGSFSTIGLCNAVAIALSTAGTQIYSVTFDRALRRFTISAPGTFTLYAHSGINRGFGPWNLLGISTAADYTGTSIPGLNVSGLVYNTQFYLQSYLDPSDNTEVVDQTVNETVSGDIEMIAYGERSYTSFEITLVTNRNVLGGGIRNNPLGVECLRSLMNYAKTKGKIEFMPDENHPENYFTVILESTPDNSKGIGHVIKEMYDQNLVGFYTTGILKFRIIED